MTNHTTLRRAFLAGLAAAPAVLAAPAVASPGPSPDAELVRLGHEWRRLYDLAERAPDDVFDAACEARFKVEEVIVATPAAGFVGLAAKAQLFDLYDSGEGIGLLDSILADVRRLAGQAAS